MRAQFDEALFGADWDASCAQQRLAQYLKDRRVSPARATGYLLSAISALRDAKAQLVEAERLLATAGIALGASAPPGAPTITPPVIPSRREPAETDEEIMLAVIRAIESGNRPDKIGKKGERSAYQFMPMVWRFHTQVPFEMATTHPAIADVMARRHLAQLHRELATLRLPWTPEFIYAAWHHGSPHAGMHARDDDAQRAFVIYHSYADR